MEEENAPLLDNEGEIPTEVPNPREKIRSLYASDRVLGRHSHYNGNEGGTINITASSSVQNFAEVDQIVSIFVVAFDTKAGNVIEWCLPDDSDLEGVEFKSMTSGSHTLRTDFVYFKKDNLFGLACFENMPVESEIERGARMKSVGILATSYTLLYRHMQFLQTQVRHLLEYRDTMAVENGHQLETPGRYGQLQAFWEDKKGMLPTSPRPPGLLPTSESYNSLQLGGYTPGGSPDNDMLPELKITHPTGSFSQFIQFFGAQIFVLWKYTLLGKRILFFSPPPIGDVCYRVYCTCSLALSNLSGGFSTHELRPHFYVNVADIDTLETEMSYIACTTEKIFESKTRLYDVYVNNQNVTTHSPILKDLLKPSEGDYDKLKKLNNQRSAQRFASEELGEPSLSEEEVFMTFFLEQNNRLFQTLMDVSASQDRTLTSDHMKAMGLDPTGDRNFVMELVESYGIDVMLMVDNPCCPR